MGVLSDDKYNEMMKTVMEVLGEAGVIGVSGCILTNEEAGGLRMRAFAVVPFPNMDTPVEEGQAQIFKLGGVMIAENEKVTSKVVVETMANFAQAKAKAADAVEETPVEAPAESV